MKYCPSNGKQCFRTKGKALRAARNMELKHKGVPSVYLCPECCRWHLTHYSYRDIHDFIRQPRQRNKPTDMQIVIDTAFNDSVKVIIEKVKTEMEEFHYIGLRIFDSEKNRYTALTYEQACELVEALKIQIAKL